MRKNIEFINNAGKAVADPIEKTKGLAFRDIVFKDKYKTKKAKFGSGITWLRILPAIKPSLYDWMMPIEVHQDINGVTFTSPRTLDSNAHSVFETARIWFQRNNKLALASKDKNPNGLRLYSKRYGVSWIIDESAPEGEKLKLIYASLYDGARGGTTGLAYNIRKEAEARDNEPGSSTIGDLIHGDITDPTEGRLVKVERNLADKNEYASYKAGIGKNKVPVDHYLAQLNDEEMDLIVPLEKTLYIPTEEEQQEILRRYIGEKFYHDIFGPVAPKVSGWNGDEEEVVTPAKPKVVAEVVVAPAEKVVVEKTTTPYTTREVTSLIGKEKDGVVELLENKGRLSKTHLDIVLESAKEYNIDVSEYGLEA